MKKRRGLTLVEMVCSMFLISLIALGIGLCTRTSFLNLVQAKSITTEAYDMMKKAELIILDVREKLSDPAAEVTDYYAQKTGNIFAGQWGETDITLYKCAVDSDSFYKYQLMVGEERIPEMKTPTVMDLNIYFAGSSIGLNDTRFTYYFSGAKILSSCSIDTPDTISQGVTTFKWYVSNKGFNIASTVNRDIDASLNEEALPIFPKDYSVIAAQGVTSENLGTLVEQYAGRNIVLAAVPSSGTTGKMGSEAISNSVFISGIPNIKSDSLKIHFDASVGVDISKSSSDSYEIDRWYDLSGNGASFEKTGSPAVDHEQLEGGSFARYFTFGPSDHGTIASSGSSDELSLFTVVRARNASEAAILSTNDFILGLTGVEYISGPLESLSSTHIPSNDEWYAVGMTIKDGVISFSINGEDIETLPLNESVVCDLSLLYLADNRVTTSDVDISEVILYNTALSGTDYTEIMDYLIDKFDIS